MIKIDEAIIVEGKYDKIRLESVVDALIITTDGFSIFNNREKQALIRKLAERRGILILTDSDSAGFMIRNFLCGCVPKEKIKHAYIPEIIGKEKRKSAPSKEGTLGVEGMKCEVIENALRNAGISYETEDSGKEKITRAMLYEDGLMGKDGSAALREALLKELALPQRLSTTAMLNMLNSLITADEYRNIIDRFSSRRTNRP